MHSAEHATPNGKSPAGRALMGTRYSRAGCASKGGETQQKHSPNRVNRRNSLRRRSCSPPYRGLANSGLRDRRIAGSKQKKRAEGFPGFPIHFLSPNFRWFDENGVFQQPRLITEVIALSPSGVEQKRVMSGLSFIYLGAHCILCADFPQNTQSY